MSDVDYSLIFNDEQDWTEKKLRAILNNERGENEIYNDTNDGCFILL